METIKEKCENYLDTRVYNYIKARKRQKAILRDRKKFQKFKFYVNILNSFKISLYSNIFLGFNVKNSFIELHFIKMLKHYNYIKFYHENIKKFKNEELGIELKSFIDYKQNIWFLGKDE